jgi:ABC-type nitrate/sulfonate/bicarbonate transport system substrate-binding protein
LFDSVKINGIRENPDEIVKMIKAVLAGIEYIRANKAEILAFLDNTWGIKSAAVREGFYADMVELYSRTGIVPDDLIGNVVRFVQETRKTQENIAIADITDWSFAKKANEQLKR